MRVFLMCLIGGLVVHSEQKAVSYRMLQAVRESSFVAQANDLAASGYRIVAWDGYKDLIAIFEKLPEGDPTRYQYAFVGVPGRKNDKIEGDLNRLGSGAFHMLSWTLPYHLAGFLLERESGAAESFAYRVHLTGAHHLFNEGVLQNFERDGFRFTQVFASNHWGGAWLPAGVLESSTQAKASVSQHFRDIGGGNGKESNLAQAQKELSVASAEGYRLLGMAWDMHAGDERTIWDHLVIWMRADDRSLAHFEYRLTSDMGVSMLQDKLNAAGADGFRLIPKCMFFTGEKKRRLAALLEKDPTAAQRYEYSIVVGEELPELLEKINKLAVAGSRPKVILPGTPDKPGYGVVLEKISPEKTSETQ